jgi:hypothetical protein
VTKLYWSSDLVARGLPEETKSCNLKDVIEIRRGNDPDPDHQGLFGTPTLRRKPPKPHQLENCFSLILRDRFVSAISHLIMYDINYIYIFLNDVFRTVDIECKNSDDFFSLFSNLQKQCLALKTMPPGRAPTASGTR